MQSPSTESGSVVVPCPATSRAFLVLQEDRIRALLVDSPGLSRGVIAEALGIDVLLAGRLLKKLTAGGSLKMSGCRKGAKYHPANQS